MPLRPAATTGFGRASLLNVLAISRPVWTLRPFRGAWLVLKCAKIYQLVYCGGTTSGYRYIWTRGQWQNMEPAAYMRDGRQKKKAFRQPKFWLLNKTKKQGTVRGS